MARIASGGGSHTRVLVTIGEEEKTVRSRYECTLSVSGSETISFVERSYATRRVLETCSASDGDFTNDYWFQGGTLRQTRQWMGADLGYILLSRLRD